MRLLPSKTTFFDMFDQHTANLVEIARELRDLLYHFDRVPEREAQVKALEHKGDEITHAIAQAMHASFVTPLDKEDIAAISSGLDDIADYADAVAARMVLYQIPESTPEAQQLADHLVQCIDVLKVAVAGLRSTREQEKVLAACHEIHRLENETDRIYRGVLGRLFNTPGIDPIMVMKWKEIYERLEMAVDKCEDVADRVEAIQLKYN